MTWFRKIYVNIYSSFMATFTSHPSCVCVCVCFLNRGENVEDAFLEAAKKIYQNIQDGSLDLNAAESGVQHKPNAPQGGRLSSDTQPQKEGCSC